MATPDLDPGTRTLAEVVRDVRDDQLSAPTPCTDHTVGDLLDHVDGLARAFTAAANKTPITGPDAQPKADAANLGDDWRSRIPVLLAELAKSWRNPDAWTGMTQAGGVDLPGEVCAFVAINEVVVHGWDIATATGQPFDADPQLVEAAIQFVQPQAASNPEGTPGLFGPARPVAEDAPPLHRLLALTGRDPSWQPPA